MTGGKDIHLHGNGYGTLDGNGQVRFSRRSRVFTSQLTIHQTWYDFIGTKSNYPGEQFLQIQAETLFLLFLKELLLQELP